LNPIPHKLRTSLNDDAFYHKCCLTGKVSKPGVKIDWHHAWKYAGKQLNAEWNIFPIWDKMHNFYGLKEAVHNSKETENFIKYIALLRADVRKLCIEYPKKDWVQEFNYLHRVYEREFYSERYSSISKDFRTLWSISLSKE